MPSKAKVSANSTKGKIEYTILPFVKCNRNLPKVVRSQFDYVTQGISKDIEFDYHLAGNRPLNFD